MMKFARKPDVVEAVQWFKMGDHVDVLSMTTKQGSPYVNTAYGVVFVQPGDWIVTAEDGEVGVAAPEEFLACYSPLEPEVSK